MISPGDALLDVSWRVVPMPKRVPLVSLLQVMDSIKVSPSASLALIVQVTRSLEFGEAGLMLTDEIEGAELSMMREISAYCPSW